MPTYPAGLPVGYVSLSIYDLIGDLGATGDADDLPDVADVTLTVEMIPTAKMITYGGKGYRLRAYTWTGVSVLTAPDGTGSYTLPATTTLTQAGTAWQWQARISVAAGSVTTQLTTPPFDLAPGATVDLLPLIPVEAQSLDVAALVIVPPGGLPSQSGNAGKVLTTDGVSATWTTAPTGGGATDWSTLTSKPAYIAAGTTAAAARTAIGAGTSDVAIGTASGTAADAAVTTAALAGKASTVHTHTASGVSDSTTVGRAVLTAADAAAARTAIGAIDSTSLPAAVRLVPTVGSAGQVLTVVSGTPAWASPATGTLTNPLLDPTQATIDGLADGTYYAITT